MQGVGEGEKYPACHAGTREPAGIRQVDMLRPHGQHVFTRHQEFTDVIGEGAVAIGALAQVIAVDPYPRVLVDALKGHPGQLSLCLLRKGKAEAVPADPAGQVARAAGTIPGKG
ncbi:hypothetical protein SDC9_208766 [bioreactor metagenome]|uniref:Uncharacterized protein n=1 Tax=bioreactor metagenome TaxID=1076179 RepID=A0A645JCY6_9ZZZZ